MSWVELRFKCPECGCEELTYRAIAWMTGFGIRVRVHQISDESRIDLGHEEENGNEIERYECRRCSFILRDENGSSINDEDDLVSWLRSHCVETGLTLESDYAERRKARV